MDSLVGILAALVALSIVGRGAGVTTAAAAAAPSSSTPPRDPNINPVGGVGVGPYGPDLPPQFTAQTADGLTIAYATRDLYYREIPVSTLPSYNLDPRPVTTPITDALGAVVGWLIPVAGPGVSYSSGHVQ